MIFFVPTSIQLQQAEQFADIYQKKGYGKNVLNVSHEEYIHFIKVGKLCEIILIDYLRSLGVEIDAPNLLVPKSGNHRLGADFIILPTRQEVDVKAANKSFHKRILIREDQFQAHIHEIYIGAKYVSNTCVEFYGYILGEALKNIPPKDFGYGLCRYFFLEKLSPIEQFIQYCKEHKKITE